MRERGRHLWARATRFRHASIRTRVLAIVAIMLATQIVLGVYLVHTVGRSQAIVEALRREQVEPLEQLKAVSDAYGFTIVNVAHKVRNGNMPAGSGLSAIDAARTTTARRWSAYRTRSLSPTERTLALRVEIAMGGADATVERLAQILRSGSSDRLDFFVTGDLYAGIDPLAAAIDDLMAHLRSRATIAQQAADREFARAYWVAGIVIAASLVVGLLSILAAIVGVSRPIRALAEALHAHGAGHQVEVPGTGRGDEIGDVARALAFAQATANEARRLAHEADAAQARQREAERSLQAREVEMAEERSRRAVELEAALAAFERDSSIVAEALAAAATQMRAAAAAMAERALVNKREAAASASAALQATQLVQATAGDSEALVTSIDAIRARVEHTSRAVGEMRSHSGESRRRMSDLEGVVDEIGGVLDLIANLATQTNLLALNATIEAARAGEAGRGFAVVAGEVKRLAAQSREATVIIAEWVGQVREATHDAVSTMQAIDSLVDGVGNSSGSISSAINEQARSTQQIAEGVAQIAQASAEAARNLDAISHRATAADQQGHALREMADAIGAQTEALLTSIEELRNAAQAA